tara:strand:+ start:108 stop:257 length:150 start_codon:yes stop_codon:yes gene_type:complete
MTLVDELNVSVNGTKTGDVVIWGALALALGYGAARFSSVAFDKLKTFFL